MKDEGLETLMARLKLHAEKRELVPIRLLLADPRVTMLAALAAHAAGNQFGIVLRLLDEHEAFGESLTIDSPLAQSGMTTRDVNALEDAGYLTFRDLQHVPETKLLRIPSFGYAALADLKKWLVIAVANTRQADAAGEKPRTVNRGVR